jgi:hypothetical protein
LRCCGRCRSSRSATFSSRHQNDPLCFPSGETLRVEPDFAVTPRRGHRVHANATPVGASITAEKEQFPSASSR